MYQASTQWDTGKEATMRRTAWIWAVGSAAWTFDCIVNLHYRNLPHAELAFLVALMFGIAWAYYRQQKN